MKTPVDHTGAGCFADPHAARHAHGGRLKPLARHIRFAILLGLAAGSAYAGPQGGQVVGGQGRITAPDALTTRITQQSSNLAIDWQSFNLKSNELVEFRQPGRDAQALNRIFDQSPSQIFGRLNANGRVLLMNPNGIVFGPGAQVNVGSLVAAGMRVKVDDFMAGRLPLEGVDGSDGVVVNQGLIAAATGGDVTLVGKAVRNEGVILATAGRVNLAAGNKVTLDFDGDGLVRFTVDEAVLDNAKALDSAISNPGTIAADGGTVMIEARAAADVFTHTVNNGGAIRAARVDSSGGVIRLVGSGPDASVINTGTLDASAAGKGDAGRIEIDADGRATLAGGGGVSATGGAGGKGGEVRVLGTAVELADQAHIDVSGPAGGGSALLGGDRAGGNPDVRNAGTTAVAADVQISASATEAGDGGTVIVWSNGTTTFLGGLVARGGPGGGAGGFAEVSGRRHLRIGSHPDLSAPLGKAGRLLLDPPSVQIQHGVNAAPPGTNDLFNDGWIVAQLDTGAGGTDLEIKTSDSTAAGKDGNLQFVDNTVDITWTKNSTLTLTAEGDAVLNGTISGHALTVNFGTTGGGGQLSFNNANVGGVATLIANGGSGADTFNIDTNLPAGTTLSGFGGGDSFVFAAGKTIGGTINGGGGSDTLNFSAYVTALGINVTGFGVSGVGGTTAAIGGGFSNIDAITFPNQAGDTLHGPDLNTTWQIDGAHSGSLVTGGQTLQFTNVASLTGGTADDTFTISGAGTIVSIDGGAGGTNALTGADAVNTWALTGAGAGTLNGEAFSNIQNLTGGNTDDSFQFNGGSITGTLNGGAGGTNKLDYTNDAGAIAVNLGALSATRTGGFSNIDTIIGNNSNTTLTGTGGNDAFSITAANAGTVGAITFSKVTSLAGGAGADTFTFANGTSGQTIGVNGNGGGADALDFAAEAGNLTVTINSAGGGSVGGITFSNISTVDSGAGNDQFNFSGTGSLAGNLAAGGGTNHIDFSASTAVGVVANLQTSTLSSLLTGTFSGVTDFVGNGGTSTLRAPDGGVSIAVTGASAGTVTGGFTFSGFPNLTGGSGNDTFTVSPGATFTSLDGGAGTNTLSGPNTANTWVLSGAGSGSLNAQAFSNMQNLTGGNTDDAFQFNGGSITGTLDAGAGGTNKLDYTNDAGAITVNLGASTATRTGGFANIDTIVGNNSSTTLIGTAGADTFSITANNAGTVGAITFSKITSLGGGAGGNDSFVFNTDNVTLSGTIDGGAGTATLSFAGYTSSRNVTLDGTGTTHGFKGHEAAIGGGAANGFDDIDILAGGSSTGDTLTGLAAVSTWNLGLTKTYVSTNTLTFSAIENLTAGGAGANTFNVSQNHGGNLTGAGGDDQFVFTGSAVLSGAIDGQAGNDTLSFAGYGSSVSVNAKGGSGKGDVSGVPDPIVSGSDDFTGVETVIGATTITAPNGQTNTWNVTGVDAFTLNGTAYTGVHQVVGGDQVDNFTIQNAGQLSGATGIDGGTGANTLTVAAASSFGITGNDAGSVTTGGGATTFTNIGTFTGSAGADTFALSGTATVTSITGGGGADILDWTAYNTARNVTITSVGANGATGAEASITAGFANITTLKSKAGASGQLSGPNVANTWTLTGADAGTLATAAGSIAFLNFGNLQGGTGTDAVTINGGTLSTGISGGGAAAGNTITGGNVVNAWALTAANGGNVNGLAFSGFANLAGGSNDDTFTFKGTGITGNLNGGAGGTNRLDYSDAAESATSVTVNLGAGTATRVGGTFTAITDVLGNGANTTLVGRASNGSYVLNAAGSAGTLTDGIGAVTFSAVGTLGGNPVFTNTLDLSAAAAALTFTIGNTNDAGTVNTATPLAFSGMQKLTGGAGNDTFLFTGTGRITNTANGGGGANNTLDFSAVSSAVTVNLGSLVNIQTVVGSLSSTNDTLVGTGAAEAFNVTSNNAGTAAGIAFSNFESLQGGGGHDVYTLSPGVTLGGSLTGGAGQDDFVFGNGASVAGGIDGAGGANTLDFSASATARNVTLTAPGTTTGFKGTEAAITGGFDNITVITNPALGGGVLTGANLANNVWTISGADSGSIANGARTLTFTNFAKLVGGTGTDGFVITGGGVVSGNPIGVDGGGGVDSLTADNAANSWDMSSATAGALTTLGGIVRFTGISALVGNANNDTFTFQAGVKSLGTTTVDGGAGGTNAVHFNDTTGVLADLGLMSNVGSIDVLGAGGTNTLKARAAGTTFNVTGVDSGTIDAGTPSFTNFGSLTGAAGNDFFVFTTGTVTGSVDGGAGANTIDFHTSVLVQLFTSTGVGQGTIRNDPPPVQADLISGSFTSVQSVIGNGLGTLFGPDVATVWLITGLDSGTYGPVGNENNFNNFRIVGGIANDDFRMSAAGKITGFIDGGAGVNSLTGALAASNTWAVNDTAGGAITTAAGATTFKRIQTLVAGDSGDAFTFDTVGFAGNVSGGAGADAFNVNVSIGGSVSGGAGNNTFTLAPGVAVGGSLTGGANTDAFVFGNAASVAGSVDGGAGTNTLNWAASAIAHNVTLTAPGTTTGFKGTEAGIAGGFDDITDIVNPALPTTGTLTGANLTNLWTLSAADTGHVASGGRTLNFTNFANIAGGTGSDTLDWSAFASGRTLAITSLGAGGATGIDASLAKSLTGTFSGIEAVINKTGAAGSITGPNATNVWTVTGTNDGTLGSGGGTLAFTDFTDLVGGAGNDSFVLSTGTLSGKVDGLAGTDTLSYAGGPAATIAITGAGTVDGVQGTATSLGAGFDDIDVAIGSGAADTLTGGPGTALWTVGGGSGSYVNAGRTLAFSAIENLTGGAGDNTFNVSGSHTGNLSGGGNNSTFNLSGVGTVLTGNLVGGANDNTFTFANDARVTGSVAGGGAGTDTLNWSASTSAVVLTFTNPVSLDQGSLAPLIGGGFTSIDAYVTNNALSTMTGPDAASTWTIDGANSFKLKVGAALPKSFTGFGSIVGGNQNDDVVIAAGGSLTGSLDGGAGTNTLTGPDAPTSWSITGAAAGTVTNIAGGFTNIANLTGGTAADAFTIVGASVFNGLIDGGLVGANSLRGGDVANTWNLTNAGQGNIGGKSAFQNIQSLVGGSQDDTFRFSNGSTFATLDAGPGTDRLDYSAVAGPITVDLKAHSASLVTTAGGTTNVEALTGSASGADTLVADDTANTWTLTALNQGTLNGFAYSGIENLTGGAGTDLFVVTGAGKLAGGIIDGAGGSDEIRGQNLASAWNITGADAGTMNTNTFTGVENLTAQGANATLAFAAAGGLSGRYTAPQITLTTTTINTGGAALNLVGDVASAGAETITAGAITVSGNLSTGGTLTMTSAAAPISVGGTLTSGGGMSVTTGGGAFSVGGALSTFGATGIVTGGGAITAASVDAHGQSFSAQAPTGTFTTSTIAAGDVAIDSANGSVAAVTTTGSQIYAGTTTFNGDLHGGDLVFNGTAQFAADVLMESSTNTFTFNGPVLGNGSLDINPTAGTSLVIDTAAGARHLSSTAFSGYHGHLIIGGILTPRTPPAENAAVTAINADRISIDSAFSTHGDMTLLASNIDLLADLTATGGQVTMLAVGDTQGKGSPSGDITGPASGAVAIAADKAVLIANNAIANNQNIRLDLGGGPVLVAVSSTVQQPTFDPGSNATSQTFDPTTLKIISSLTNPIGVQAVQVVFSNPAAALTGLQNVQFVDVGVFEQDLTLFGVLGNGIALSLDQCEEKEGCAPNITPEQLERRIAERKQRIAELEARGGMDEQLAQLRSGLANLETYRKQLHDYQEAQEESGAKFEEFDEGAIGSEAKGGEKGKGVKPAAPAEPEESLEEAEKPAAAVPKAAPPKPAAPPAKPAEFEELDETLDDKPKTAPVQPAPAAPAAKPVKPAPVAPRAAPARPQPAKPAGKPADNPDEFEELDEEIDDSPVLSLADNAIPVRRGAIGLDGRGRVRWQGALLLPPAHARY